MELKDNLIGLKFLSIFPPKYFSDDFMIRTTSFTYYQQKTETTIDSMHSQ